MNPGKTDIMDVFKKRESRKVGKYNISKGCQEKEESSLSLSNGWKWRDHEMWLPQKRLAFRDKMIHQL